MLFTEKNKKSIALSLAATIVLPVLAWLLLPTFQNRLRYFVYDYSYIKSSTYLPGANDGGRVLSLKGGWSILQNNPLGVGCGDVYDETNKWYTQNVPAILPSDRLYPSSEWLLYGGAAGWPGFLLFSLVMIIPLFYRSMQNLFFWIALNSTAAFSFMFDIGLEVQYGVFLYSFIVLWWWKWFKKETVVHG
jgi:hypothetical protein